MVYHQKEQFDSGWRLQNKTAPLVGAVLFGCVTPTIEAARQRRFDEGRFGGE